MKIHGLFLTLSLSFSFSMQSQTLFSFGNEKTDAKEFVTAYKKANPDKKMDDRAVREYLSLYINSRLKIHEAYQRGYDTLPGFLEELNSLRQQVIENYMMDEETYNRLLNEAFDRSQKEIQVQHIYIPYTGADSVSARQRIREAHMQLGAGKKFEEVAAKYSMDPAVADNKGSLGFISVFTLPYAFESIIYSLPAGKYSNPHKSAGAFHIFRNASERKAKGKIKTAQILLSFAPGISDDEKSRISRLADSLYQRVIKGDDFAQLATAFSNDYVTAASGGQIPEFSAGTFDPVFENNVLSLDKDGAVSRPFTTSHGIHIVKRISLSPPSAVKDKKTLDLLRYMVEQDPRINLAKDKLIENVLAKTDIKEAPIDKTQLKIYIDSISNYRPAPANSPVKKEDPLFTIGDITNDVARFSAYVLRNRAGQQDGRIRSLDELYEGFKKETTMDYYRRHLEDFNSGFKNQMKELKDGNLFFDIMMKEVWEPAQTDTAGQKSFFDNNRSKYRWVHSADAVIFYCGNEETAHEVRETIARNPDDWRNELLHFEERVSSDSGRFEISRLPGLQKKSAATKMITAVEKNSNDNSASFAYILRIHDKPAAKTLDEAKGEVISDFQDHLDKKWTEALKKKYPVKVNEQVLKSLVR